MKKEDFHLEVNDGTLTLSGERKGESLTDGVEYHRNETVMAGGHMAMVCEIFLSAANRQAGRHQASYRDGILEIHVPKVEEAKPRQIAISVES